jgi:uncharacterized linocin/CFP29 family protein
MNPSLDFILNGTAQGSVASRILATNGDVGVLRPFVGNDGRSYISILQADGKRIAIPTNNATATLRKDEWIQLDTAIIKAAKPRLRLVSDLRGSGLTYTLANGLGKTVLQHETQSDISDALVSMDGLRKSENDRPTYELSNLPLPLIHKDFSISLRQLMASRQGGSPLDTTLAELAGRRVAEAAEKLATGTFGSYAFGGGTLYGLVNFPSRITHQITNPTATAWTPATTVEDVLDMIQKSKNKFHYGPWILYASSAWDRYLDADYSAQYSGETLRSRLKKLDSIQDVKTLDYLEATPGSGSSYILVLVQQTSDVIREVVGMDITTVQWESEGGMQINYKVMAMLVPQLRADQNGNTGIVHGAP